MLLLSFCCGVCYKHLSKALGRVARAVFEASCEIRLAFKAQNIGDLGDCGVGLAQKALCLADLQIGVIGNDGTAHVFLENVAKIDLAEMEMLGKHVQCHSVADMRLQVFADLLGQRAFSLFGEILSDATAYVRIISVFAQQKQQEVFEIVLYYLLAAKGRVLLFG